MGLFQDKYTLSTAANTWEVTGLGGKRIFPYVSQAVQTDNLTGLSVTTTVSYNPGDTSDIDGIPYGHIQMYNGNIWISDFKQLRDFWPGSGYRTYQPPYVIYRWSY